MSSFAAKKRNTNATRKRTRARLEGTGEDGGRRGTARPGIFVSKEAWAARLAQRAAAPPAETPAAALHIDVLDDANERQRALVEFVRKLREAEKSQRQKTRVLVFCTEARTARALERAVGTMVAKKQPSKGYRGLGLGSATRTSWESKGAATMQAGMQESYVTQLIRDFKGGKLLTVLATDDGAKPLASAASAIGTVISFDPPPTLAVQRQRVAFAAGREACCRLFWTNTKKERETMEPTVSWMADHGCAVPAAVREALGLAPAAEEAAAPQPLGDEPASAEPEAVDEAAAEPAGTEPTAGGGTEPAVTAEHWLAALGQMDETTLDGAGQPPHPPAPSCFGGAG